MHLTRAAAAAMRFLAEEGWTLQQFAETFEGGAEFENSDPVVFEDCACDHVAGLRFRETSGLRDEACGSLGVHLVEGMFTIVLYAKTDGKTHTFITQNDGVVTAKSPMDMFDPEIPNDLGLVDRSIREYYDLPALEEGAHDEKTV